MATDNYPVRLKMKEAKEMYEFIRVLGQKMYQSGGGDTAAYDAFMRWEAHLLAAILMARVNE